MMVGFGPSASAVSVNGYAVDAFFMANHYQNGVDTYSSVTTASLNANQIAVYNTSKPINSFSYGIRVAIPANASPSYLSVSGFCSAFSDNFASNSWKTATYSSSTDRLSAFEYYYVSSAFPSYADWFKTENIWSGEPVFIPAHTGTIYLYLFSYGRYTNSVTYSTMGLGVYRMSTSSIYLTGGPATDITLQASNTLLTAIRNALTSTGGTNPTLKAIQTSVDAIKNSLSGGSQSPMDKFESDYLTNFQNQVNKTEDYIGSSSPVLPNNFVSSSGGGSSVVDSLSDGFGLSSDSFNESDFNGAVDQLGGSASVNEGGPWYFFTEGVMSGMETGSASSVSGDDWLEAWVSDAERRYGLWATP